MAHQPRGFAFPQAPGDSINVFMRNHGIPAPTTDEELARDCLQYATLVYQDGVYFDKCLGTVKVTGHCDLPAIVPRPREQLPSGNCDPFVFTPRLDRPTAAHVRALAKFTHVSFYVHHGVPMLAGIYNPAVGHPGSRPVLVIAFRGTNTLHELFFTDFRVRLENADIILPHGGAPAQQAEQEPQAHSGFVGYLRHLSDILIPILNDTSTGDGLNTSCKEMPVLFTGHSLGGAVSMLAAYNTARGRLETGGTTRPDLSVGCITFGCPRVGDQAFCNQISNQGGSLNNMGLLLCFEADRDPVVKLPLTTVRFPFSNPDAATHVIHLGRPDGPPPAFPYWNCLPDHFPTFYEELMEDDDPHHESSAVGRFRDKRIWLRWVASAWPVVDAWDELSNGRLLSMFNLGWCSCKTGTAWAIFDVGNLYQRKILPSIHHILRY